MTKINKEKLIEFVKKHWKYLALAITFILLMSCIRQCNKASEYKKEIARIENNMLAINDTLKNYKNGKYNMAEMRAMQLRIDELADSLKLERNKKPVTIIKYVATTSDSIITESVIHHDTIYVEKPWSDYGYITASDTSIFGNSNRIVNVGIPYRVNCETGFLESNGNAEIEISQNIWLESILYGDKKGQTYVQLKTDYPSVKFNDGGAILVTDKSYDYKSRKQFGIGLGVQIGYGAALSKPVRLLPYIGIGLSLNWNPRFLQF